MKKVITVIIMVFIFICGCDTTNKTNSDVILSTSSIDSNSVAVAAVVSSDEGDISIVEASEVNFDNAVINENYPIVFYEKRDDEIGFVTLLIGGSKDGAFTTIYDYTYNNTDVLDFVPDEIYDIKSELIKTNDLFDFYDKNTTECKTVCESVDLFFSYSTPTIMPCFSNEVDLSDDIMVGISCDWDVFPRNPVFEENKVTVDIDGNGVLDEIQWEKNVSDESGNYDKKLIINYNGKEYIRKITTPLYSQEYSVVNVIDLNGDGKMEIIEYNLDLGAEYVILDISENGFTEIISYIIGDN